MKRSVDGRFETNPLATNRTVEVDSTSRNQAASVSTFPNCSEGCPGKYILNKVQETFLAHRLHAQQVYGGDLVMVQSEVKMNCLDNIMRLQNNDDNNGYWLGGTGTQQGSILG